MDDAFELFREEAEIESSLADAIDRADRLYSHLQRNVNQLIRSPVDDSPTKVRRHNGLQWRMHYLVMAQEEVRASLADMLAINRELVGLARKHESTRRAKAGGRGRLQKNPIAREKNEAMQAIKLEWERMNRREIPFRSDAKFARDMRDKFPILDTERSVQNAIGRWRKESSS